MKDHYAVGTRIALNAIKKLWRLITLQAKNNNESEEIVLSEYYIEKVSSLEESGRQLTSVFSILIGAYLAILINDVSITMIKNIVRIYYNFFDDKFDPIKCILIAYFLTIFPVFPLLVGIFLSAKILWPENQELDLSSKTKSLYVFLNITIKKKYSWLRQCYRCLYLGIILLLLIFTFNILSPIYFSYTDADEYYQQGKYDEAIKSCDKSIAEISDFEGPWRLKGKCYYMLGNYSEAIKSYNESVRLNPKSKDVWYLRGLAYLSLPEYDEAIENFKHSIILDQNFSEAWFRIGLAHELLNEYDKAIKAFDNATKINSSYALAWHHKGMSHYYQGNYKDAIMSFDQAIMSEQNCSVMPEQNWLEICFVTKGMAHESLNEHDKAIKAFDNATKINPNYALAWYLKGESLYYQGNYKDAITNFDQAINLKQNFSEIWFVSKGMAHESLNEHDKAIKAFDNATKINPSYALAWYLKGKTLRAQNRTEEANAAFAKAKELGYKANSSF